MYFNEKRRPFCILAWGHLKTIFKNSEKNSRTLYSYLAHFLPPAIWNYQLWFFRSTLIDMVSLNGFCTSVTTSSSCVSVVSSSRARADRQMSQVECDDGNGSRRILFGTLLGPDWGRKGKVNLMDPTKSGIPREKKKRQVDTLERTNLMDKDETAAWECRHWSTLEHVVASGFIQCLYSVVHG